MSVLISHALDQTLSNVAGALDFVPAEGFALALWNLVDSSLIVELALRQNKV